VRIIDLMGRKSPFLSLEFFPPKEKEAWPRFFQTAGKLAALDPLFVSVTYGAGGGAQEHTLDIVTRMNKDLGVTPMAHLTCVGATREYILGFLDRLRQGGIDNVLALRGDPPKDQPDFSFENQPFRHGSDLAELIRAEHPDMGVAVTAYPEPHVEAASVADELRWAEYKLSHGGDFAITQLFFDNRIYLDFVERLRARGVDRPVLPGILPILSLKSAKFILSLCGANIPGRFLAALEKAHDAGGDDAVYRLGLDYAKAQARELLAAGAPGVHLYTLNRAAPCLEIGQDLGLV
jgi:methylenetetrahydrofolate reductase (NADPH)